MNIKAPQLRFVAAVGSVAAVLGALSVATPTNGDAAKRSETKRLTKRYLTAEAVDNGKQGDSAGDMLVSTARVSDSRGHRVGRDEAVCIRTVAGGAFSCNATLLLHDGRIYYAVRGEPDGSAHGAVTGGTGRYIGAGGSVNSPAEGLRIERRFSFRLIFP